MTPQVILSTRLLVPTCYLPVTYLLVLPTYFYLLFASTFQLRASTMHSSCAWDTRYFAVYFARCSSSKSKLTPDLSPLSSASNLGGQDGSQSGNVQNSHDNNDDNNNSNDNSDNNK